MVAAAAAVVARHLCSDDGDGDGKRAKARSPPPPSVHCGAPFLARGCCCGGGGGRGGAARSWRRRPPLLWLSLARSLGRGSCCRRFSMSWWRRPTLWLSCCPALQHELVPAHDSGCWPTAGADSTLASARPLPATTRQPSGRPGPPALQLAPSRAERAKGDGGLRRAAGAVLCRASCAPPSRRTLTTGTTASSVLQAAAGSVGLLAGAPSRRLPDRARLPACLLPVTVLAGVGRPAARQSAISTAIAEPASPLLDDPALRPRPS